ncbi:hypothetical protein K502DRAFT_362647 [Neoconidiobolus thromboides FSU 785]|nr:hypothetical protein K502DRAFT_362647 [Neoconidiobolus thromboides FSU 785]
MLCFKVSTRESLRLIPGVANLLFRKVPNNGKTINSYFLPRGIIVSTNIYILHYDPDLWSEDVKQLRSEKRINEDNSGFYFNNEKYFTLALYNQWLN